MKKLPSGVSNFETLIEENYYYVDKTKYIQKLEDYPNRTIIFLRPRKFGKTLFTSVLENYYDVNKKEKFDTLFGETYIGKNPTTSKNSYHILKFNFSGIGTDTGDSTLLGFKREVSSSVNLFVKKYGLDFYVNKENTAEGILDDLFKAFTIQKANEKIYVIIDEYDHFANELLSFNTSAFKELVSRNGKVRKWYEILKKGTESVVDRIFITGVAPITLDSMTSGFNIASDITKDIRFNNMMGFSKEEIEEMMDNQNISKEEQEKLMPIMKENYDGYKFSSDVTDKLYNSNMTLYFLNEYIGLGKIPDKLVDVNIASDYAKIGNMLKLCNGEKKLNILSDTLSDKGIISEITDKFNPEVDFGDKEMVSMLYYLGYLTIEGEEFGRPVLRVPNLVMREIYADYFMKLMDEGANLKDIIDYNEIIRELATTGKIEKIIKLLEEYLTGLSNRDYMRFDEKYIKLLYYGIAMNTKSVYYVKSEPEYMRNYPDILMIPKDTNKCYQAIMIEFKYLKKDEKSLLKDKQKEAIEQIKKYAEYEEIKRIENLHKYAVVAVVDKMYVEEVF